MKLNFAQSAAIKQLELNGHGHVYVRSDGVRARCGGPAFCEVCREEVQIVNHLQSSQVIDTSKIGEDWRSR